MSEQNTVVDILEDALIKAEEELIIYGSALLITDVDGTVRHVPLTEWMRDHKEQE